MTLNLNRDEQEQNIDEEEVELKETESTFKYFFFKTYFTQLCETLVLFCKNRSTLSRLSRKKFKSIIFHFLFFFVFITLFMLFHIIESTEISDFRLVRNNSGSQQQETDVWSYILSGKQNPTSPKQQQSQSWTSPKAISISPKLQQQSLSSFSPKQQQQSSPPKRQQSHQYPQPESGEKTDLMGYILSGKQSSPPKQQQTSPKQNSASPNKQNSTSPKQHSFRSISPPTAFPRKFSKFQKRKTEFASAYSSPLPPLNLGPSASSTSPSSSPPSPISSPPPSPESNVAPLSGKSQQQQNVTSPKSFTKPSLQQQKRAAQSPRMKTSMIMQSSDVFLEDRSSLSSSFPEREKGEEKVFKRGESVPKMGQKISKNPLTRGEGEEGREEEREREEGERSERSEREREEGEREEGAGEEVKGRKVSGIFLKILFYFFSSIFLRFL